jgi:acetolactate synthase-1/3 small subunit/acetolactate synthase II small subunit
VDFAPTEGALLRILGLVERRGYRIRELTLAERHSQSSLSILIEARDDKRRPDVLARQLTGLFDVSAVELSASRQMVPA